MATPLALLLTVLPASGAVSSPLQVQGSSGLPFEHLGRTLLAAARDRAGPQAAAPKTGPGDPARPFDARLQAELLPLHQVLDLGAFELWIPRETLDERGHLSKAKPPRDLRQLAQLLLGLQREWLDDLLLSDEDLQRCRECCQTLERWCAGGRWLEQVAPTKEVADAREILRDRFLTWSYAWARDTPREHGLAVVLAPTRAQLVGLVGAVGQLDTRRKAWLWTDGVRTTRVWPLAGETVGFPITWGPAETSEPALRNRPMAREELLQEFAHAASHLLSDDLLPPTPPWFGEALAILDTVRLTGEDETLCTGYRPKLEFPVVPPGFEGLPFYGWFSRELSPFRGGPSRALFVKELRGALRGGKLDVVDLDTGERASAVSPPLLGADAGIPAALLRASEGSKQGFAELYRAYGAACAHFLASRPSGKGFTTLSRTVSLLVARRRLWQGAAQEQLSDVVMLATGKSLGLSKDPSQDLEGEFLAWLSGEE